MKKSISWSVLIYGVIILLFGIFGYVHAKSMISLYVGAGLGLLLILNSLAMFANKAWSVYTALALTILLTATFAYRYSATAKPIPAILSVISGGMLLFLMAKTTSWKE